MTEVNEIKTFMLQHFDTVAILFVVVLCTSVIVGKLILVWRVLDLQYRYQTLEFRLKYPDEAGGLNEEDKKYYHQVHKHR